MASIGISELMAIAAAMLLPCLGFLILGAVVYFIIRVKAKNGQK